MKFVGLIVQPSGLYQNAVKRRLKKLLVNNKMKWLDCIKVLIMLTMLNLWLTSKVNHNLPCLCCIKQFRIKMWLVAMVINRN